MHDIAFSSNLFQNSIKKTQKRWSALLTFYFKDLLQYFNNNNNNNLNDKLNIKRTYRAAFFSELGFKGWWLKNCMIMTTTTNWKMHPSSKRSMHLSPFAQIVEKTYSLILWLITGMIYWKWDLFISYCITDATQINDFEQTIAYHASRHIHL